MSTAAFRVLGLDRSASPDEIKRAYRALAKTCHPDLHPGLEARFREITEAYEIALKAPVAPDPVEPVRPSPMRPATRPPAPKSDPFADFQRSQARGAPGPWREVVELSLSDVFQGTMVSIRHGAGSVLVEVPAGVQDGQVIVERRAIPASIGQMRRDLHVTIRYARNTSFTVRGHNLAMTLPIGVDLAQKGGERTLTGPEGQPLWVKIPPNSRSGLVLSMPQRGLPIPGGRRGDLLITLQVQLT